MTRRALPELNTANRDLEWARLRFWMEQRLEEFKNPPEGDPESFAYKRIAKVRENLELMRPIDHDLAEAGIPVPLAGLYGCQVPYPEAIPVLLRHLALPYNDDVKESILRKIAVPYAGESAFREVHRLLLSEVSTDRNVLFCYGLALETIATKKQIPELLSIASDPRLGSARTVLIKLAKWKVPEVGAIARELLGDPYWHWYAIKCLRLLRSWGDAAQIRELVSSPNADVRAEAKAFLKAMEKATT